jgi:hypothetical protein
MSGNLRRAIKLREWTRKAIDETQPGDRRGNLHFVCPLNRAADAALRKLTPAEMGEYSAWLDRSDSGWFERTWTELGFGALPSKGSK